MESKVILLLATFALFGSNQAMPGLNVNDIYRLIGTIEPSTCECVIGQQCQIKIPYSSLLGINCNAGTDFCCTPRKRIKPFVGPKDLAELNAAAKRLKVQKNVQSLLQGVTPQQIDSTLEQLKEVEPLNQPGQYYGMNGNRQTNPGMTGGQFDQNRRLAFENYQKQQQLKVQQRAPAPVQVHTPEIQVQAPAQVPARAPAQAPEQVPAQAPTPQQPEEQKKPEVQAEDLEQEPVQDKCTCKPRNDCPEDKRDFSFGKSCDLGQVRCCLTIENPEQPEDKEEEVEITKVEEVPTMVTKSPILTFNPEEVKADQPQKQKFFVYRIPTVAPKKMVNPEQLAKQVLSRPKPTYQPDQYYGMTGNRRANLGNPDLTAARAQYEENQRVAFENYQKQQRLKVQQEAWRRKNRPTFMEKVTDILDVRTWFG